MIFTRELYLNQLIQKKQNGMVKIITGLRDVENHFFCLICFTINSFPKEFQKVTS